MLGICSNQRSMVRTSPMVLKHQAGGLYAWKVGECGKRLSSPRTGYEGPEGE